MAEFSHCSNSQLNERTTPVACYYALNRNNCIFPPLVFNQKFWLYRDLVLISNIVEHLLYSESQEEKEKMLEIEALVSTFSLHFSRQDREDLLVKIFELFYL